MKKKYKKNQSIKDKKLIYEFAQEMGIQPREDNSKPSKKKNTKGTS